MLNFVNDYSEGCIHEILDKLVETNYEQSAGYGLDNYTASAAEKIKAACGAKNASVYLLTGGTQTNMMVIESMTKPYEGVIATTQGHVNTHEAGAIEASGHKVLTLPSHEGKIDATELETYIKDFFNDSNWTHMVRPGMVYISHPTEVGTLYTKEELKAIHKVCQTYKIPLFLDGARLAYGLTAAGTDVTLADIAKLTDVFYIGGTKCGALYGEAVVWPKGDMPEQFETRVKRQGAMVAKGRIIGLQFDVLFTKDKELNGKKTYPYIFAGTWGNTQADRIRQALKKAGFKFYVKSTTNQIFVVVENKLLKKIEKKVEVSFFEKYDDTHSVVRFCTSWCTNPANVDELIKIIEGLK